MQKRTAATAAALAACAIVLVSAASKPKLTLQPGGRTIGGPVAIRNVAPGTDVVAFFFQGFAEGGLDVCSTVVNTGRGPMTFQVFGDAGGSPAPLDPGDTRIFCSPNTDNAGATCPADGPPCSFEVRVDEVSTGT
jgi:hypothetical protein